MQELRQVEKDYIDSILDRAVPITCDTAIKRAFLTACEKRMSDRKNIYREVEDMIRAKDILQENIKEYQAEINLLDMGLTTRTSSSCLVGMAQKRLSKEEIVEVQRITLEAKLERDTAKIEALERGLSKVKEDKYYSILDMKYVKGYTISHISQTLKIDETQVVKENYRMIKRIAWKIFGGEVL